MLIATDSWGVTQSEAINERVFLRFLQRGLHLLGLSQVGGLLK